MQCIDYFLASVAQMCSLDLEMYRVLHVNLEMVPRKGAQFCFTRHRAWQGWGTKDLLTTLERLIWGERNLCGLGRKPSSPPVPWKLKFCMAWWGQYRGPSPTSRLNPAQNTSALLVGARKVCEHCAQFHSSQQLGLCLVPDSSEGTGHRCTNRALACRVWGRPSAHKGASVLLGQGWGGRGQQGEGWHSRWREPHAKAWRHRMQKGLSNGDDSGMSPVTRAAPAPHGQAHDAWRSLADTRRSCFHFLLLPLADITS